LDYTEIFCKIECDKGLRSWCLFTAGIHFKVLANASEELQLLFSGGFSSRSPWFDSGTAHWDGSFQADWKRPAGCPQTSWLATMKNDLSFHNLSVEDATELALDSGQVTVEVIGSKRSYVLNLCKPNNDDDEPTYLEVNLLRSLCQVFCRQVLFCNSASNICTE